MLDYLWANELFLLYQLAAPDPVWKYLTSTSQLPRRWIRTLIKRKDESWELREPRRTSLLLRHSGSRRVFPEELLATGHHSVLGSSGKQYYAFALKEIERLPLTSYAHPGILELSISRGNLGGVRDEVREYLAHHGLPPLWAIDGSHYVYLHFQPAVPPELVARLYRILVDAGLINQQSYLYHHVRYQD